MQTKPRSHSSHAHSGKQEERGGGETGRQDERRSGNHGGRHVAVDPGGSWPALEAISDDAGEDEESTQGGSSVSGPVLIGEGRLADPLIVAGGRGSSCRLIWTVLR